MTFNGMRVITSPLIMPVPILEIPHDFEWCTSAYRAKHNAWLLERFGAVEPIYRISDDTVAMSPKRYGQLKKEMEREKACANS